MGRYFTHRTSHAGNESSPADRHDQVLQVGEFFQYFKRDCALTGHDKFIIERMYE